MVARQLVPPADEPGPPPAVRGARRSRPSARRQVRLRFRLQPLPRVAWAGSRDRWDWSWSDVLLTREVRQELSVIAAALTFVAIFELAASSFFLDGLFVGDMLGGHWLRHAGRARPGGDLRRHHPVLRAAGGRCRLPDLGVVAKAAAIVVRVLSILVAAPSSLRRRPARVR